MNTSRGILLSVVLIGVVLIFGRAQIAESSARQSASSDEAGFERIFDGKTLKGWEGDPKYWRVENGAIVGEITPETIVKQNTFIIFDGLPGVQVHVGPPMKVEYRNFRFKQLSPEAVNKN